MSVKFRSRGRREETQINLTALIDVVFLLLIFFMVTTTFTRESRLTVDLPQADGEAAAEQLEVLEVAVSEQGQYTVAGQLLSGTDRETLIAALNNATGGDRDRPVVLVADARAMHQAVVTAMDAIGQAGFARLSIATRSADND
jgi:biopolymer transport protein ExbD